MAMQKRPLRKLLSPLPPPGHDFRVGLLQLKNGQRMKPLQVFPQVGELPAVAGLLLYPDKCEKMVTTSEIAFGPKPYARTEPQKMLKCSLTLEGDQSYVTTNQEAYPAQALYGDPLMMMMMMRKSLVRRERTPTSHYQTHYQQSFVRPQCIYGRRLQALPRPDNLAINPALRADFKTVQMETYPGWDTCLYSRPLPAKLKEQLSLKEQSPAAGMTSRAGSSVNGR
ncbi:uncharacterized protein si:dkeyp-69c1.9 [Hemibagrus wyckioides]|uniref:uncharacterized protein si:dkeyp-69c1.9 n=1 Tax=Hemibagrus wyckioides TaxID=337641 RepID=UPI00266C37E0|nr:uncharacterized protein si:dkeyp-69c1.9 [Hemibagrus wyckioides]XP_058271478.1 uncharacterized protein si:dkeyp-69c1.9 [Hemibagrus wyckioides]XP_058271479.1 uncharacterized protein si:dkeyp-69c1.9 [Hemibagrus wyckioides]